MPAYAKASTGKARQTLPNSFGHRELMARLRYRLRLRRSFSVGARRVNKL
jgi:hypothetical protein